MKITLKYILFVLVFLQVLAGTACKQSNKPSDAKKKVLVGAIRWDGWVGEKGSWGIGPIVERTLGPENFHYRAPFYSMVTAKDSISMDGTTQEIVDREIAYAKYAGIDYWAYCYYPDGCGLELPRKLHQTSKNAEDVKWCVVLGPSFELDSAFQYSETLLAEFARENYQKVLDGRPLIYLLHGSKFTRAKLDTLRARTTKNGMKTPYVIVMEWSAQKAADYCQEIGGDALSCYTSMGKDNLPFAEFIPGASIAMWEKYALKGEIVPWVSTGWNPGPRMESPNPWSMYYADSTSCQDAAPKDIKNFLISAIDWTKANKDRAAANTILVYAWNEFDEGFGAVCPTLGTDGKPNTDRLEAVKEALK